MPYFALKYTINKHTYSFVRLQTRASMFQIDFRRRSVEKQIDYVTVVNLKTSCRRFNTSNSKSFLAHKGIPKMGECHVISFLPLHVQAK